MRERTRSDGRAGVRPRADAWARVHREISDVARLLLGLTLASTAAAFFESKLTSPSNIAIFTTVVASAMLVRLKELAGYGAPGPDEPDPGYEEAYWQGYEQLPMLPAEYAPPTETNRP